MADQHPGRALAQEISDYCATVVMDRDPDGGATVDVTDVLSHLIGYVGALSEVMVDTLDRLEALGG